MNDFPKRKARFIAAIRKARVPLLGAGFLFACLAWANEVGAPKESNRGSSNRQVEGKEVAGNDCELHKVPLQKGIVSTTSGLVRYTKAELDAHRTLFPHAHSSYNVGCVKKGPATVKVHYCPDCRKAEATWNEARRRLMVPIDKLWEKVREAIADNPNFTEVSVYVDPDVPCVGLEGHVSTDELLVELVRLVEGFAPKQWVSYSIRVGHSVEDHRP